jgi:hypothetical protein
MSEHPIDFCIHLARAVARGQKTLTFKPLTQVERRLRDSGKPVPSPYGVVGDVLWVREPYGLVKGSLVYRADHAEDGWDGAVSLPAGIDIPAAAMTREQARSLLTVQSIEIVDLQTVDERAAHAAGTIPSYGRMTYLSEFKAQWDYTYKRNTWESNPPVWRVAFTKNT